MMKHLQVRFLCLMEHQPSWFNTKGFLLEERLWYYLTRGKKVHTFPTGICPKENVIAQSEFELAYNNFALTTTPRGHASLQGISFGIKQSKTHWYGVTQIIWIILQLLILFVEISNLVCIIAIFQTPQNSVPVGWICRIHRLHHNREIRFPQWVSWIW